MSASFARFGLIAPWKPSSSSTRPLHQTAPRPLSTLHSHTLLCLLPSQKIITDPFEYVVVAEFVFQLMRQLLPGLLVQPDQSMGPETAWSPSNRWGCLLFQTYFFIVGAELFYPLEMVCQSEDLLRGPDAPAIDFIMTAKRVAVHIFEALLNKKRPSRQRSLQPGHGQLQIKTETGAEGRGRCPFGGRVTRGTRTTKNSRNGVAGVF